MSELGAVLFIIACTALLVIGWSWLEVVSMSEQSELEKESFAASAWLNEKFADHTNGGHLSSAEIDMVEQGFELGAKRLLKLAKDYESRN